VRHVTPIPAGFDSNAAASILCAVRTICRGIFGGSWSISRLGTNGISRVEVQRHEPGRLDRCPRRRGRPWSPWYESLQAVHSIPDIYDPPQPSSTRNTWAGASSPSVCTLVSFLSALFTGMLICRHGRREEGALPQPWRRRLDRLQGVQRHHRRHQTRHRRPRPPRCGGDRCLGTLSHAASFLTYMLVTCTHDIACS
jgi:hypothetical protein